MEKVVITLDDIQKDVELMTFIDSANAYLAALGYTEHGRRHAGLVASVAGDILAQLGHDQREIELAQIAGYLHDVGNLIHRQFHALSGAMIAHQGLRRLGMAPEELAIVMSAIGNHEEERGQPVSATAAAVVLADKADVHRSRVQNPRQEDFDIHDRVNFAVTSSRISVDAGARVIALQLAIDTECAQVIEYFEIFLGRMVMMRDAAAALGCDYQLIINRVRLS